MDLKHILQQPHTVCVNCVFAQYKDMSQYGCALGKLDVFEKAEDVRVVEAEDDTSEFYLILGSYCFWSRTKGWAEKLHGYTDKQLQQKALDDTRLEYDAIVWIDDQGMDEVAKTVNNILMFERRPEKIMIVNLSTKVSLEQLVAWMNTVCSAANQKFVVKDIVDKTETVWAGIHRASRDCNSMFLYIVEAGKTIDMDATEKIHKKLFEEIKEFAVIKFDYNACLCLSSAYERVGIYDVNFLSELYTSMEEMGIQHKFKTYEEYTCQE